MELKVWFDGLPRIVCGVNDKTTCQDIVFALAQATGKTGRFTLIERSRNSDRLLAPSEVVMKWGEHASDVQYILQCAAIESKNSKSSNASTETTNNNNPFHGDIPFAPPPYRNPPSPIKSNIKTQLKDLPPYRLPPPPTTISSSLQTPSTDQSDSIQQQSFEFRDNSSERTPQQSQKLIQLINQQREKLTMQQAELTQFDAEIKFWEAKGKLQEKAMDNITKEISKLEILTLQNDTQVATIEDLEDENSTLNGETDRLKQQISTLKIDLCKCDQELSHCKSTIRTLQDTLATTEVEVLVRALTVARDETDAISALADTLEVDYKIVETDLAKKKAEMETLVSLMKEANLESLDMGEEESLTKSRRKIKGSARQLKDAAPTTTNPHGVWV